jgi:hypothetical protein
VEHNLRALLAVAISGASCRGFELGGSWAAFRSPIDRAETVSNRPWRCSTPSGRQFEEIRFQSHNLSVRKERASQ